MGLHLLLTYQALSKAGKGLRTSFALAVLMDIGCVCMCDVGGVTWCCDVVL